MKISILVIIAIGIGIYAYTLPPAAEKITRKTTIDTDNGSIVYDGTVYSAEWGDEVSHTGDIRFIARAYHELLPVITYEAIVTNGEFSDPAIVEVTPIKNGSMRWRSQKQPEGSLIVLHFIAEDLGVFHDIKNIRAGDKVEFIGREEIDNTITASNGGYVKLNHNNHRYLLVSKVNRL